MVPKYGADRIGKRSYLSVVIFFSILSHYRKFDPGIDEFQIDPVRALPH